MTEDNRGTPTPDSGVPGLIDQYRQQRRAWLAQADELVRLRDEVRAAAEREAMDIVTTARRNVRQIVVEARRELMVLTAQLHAAMDAVEQSSAASGLSLKGADEDPLGSEAVDAQASLSITRELVLGARREVRSVLDEARAEIEALASEARFRFQPKKYLRLSRLNRSQQNLEASSRKTLLAWHPSRERSIRFSIRLAQTSRCHQPSVNRRYSGNQRPIARSSRMQETSRHSFRGCSRLPTFTGLQRVLR